MNPALSVTLSFLLFAFITKPSVAFSNDVEQVLDVNGNPIFPGGKYYILPQLRGPGGGGVKLGKTGDLKCPVTVLQIYSEVDRGFNVKFTIPGISPGIIFTGTPLEIEFTKKKPNCAEASKWLVFVDKDIQKACVGIGGPENYPGKQTLSGTFNIKRNKGSTSYKLVFCVSGSETCLDIGKFDNSEGGRRLILTEHEPYNVVFVDAASYEEGIIRSVA